MAGKKYIRCTVYTAVHVFVLYITDNYLPNAGSTHWCRDSEVLDTSDGFVFCPSRDEILLRVAMGDILPVQNLPEPGSCMGRLDSCFNYSIYICVLMFI